MSRWMTIGKFAAETGYSEKAVRRKIEDRVWKERDLWRRAPDGRILMNIEEFEKWVEGEMASGQPRTAALKSRSSTTVNAAGRESRCRLLPLT